MIDIGNMKGFSALIISILLLGMLFASTPTPATADSEPPEWGDWVIKENTTVTGETIVVNGVIVENGSALTLDNCVLKIDWGVTGYNGIKVEAGGELYVYNSTITANKSYQYYRFDVYGKLRIEKTDISRTWGGISLSDTDSATIKHSTLHDFSLDSYGIRVENSCATIIDNNIYNCLGGIACFGGSNTEMVDNNIYKNTRIGIEMHENCTGIITNNIINNNGQGIGTDSGGILVGGNCRVEINSNIIDSNSLTGVFCGGDALVNISNNNVISNNDRGITCEDRTKTNIFENTISSNGIVGQSGPGIICFDKSVLNVIKNTVSNNYYGITCHDQSVIKLINNTITSSVHTGIACDDSSTIEIVGNTIDSNHDHGIHCQLSTNVTIIRNTISNNGDRGIQTQLNPDGKTIAVGNYIYNNEGHGIGIASPFFCKIQNNTITSNCIGIKMGVGAIPIIADNTIQSCKEDGIYIRDSSEPKIYNCTIIDSNEYDIRVGECSHPTIINTNFDLNKLFFNDTESIISIGHWVDVKVRNKNNVPVQNAEITIKNNDGTEVFNSSTDYNGHVSCIPVVEYDLDYTFNKTLYTPHTVYVSKLGQSASEKITIDLNRVINFTLTISDKLARGNLITAVVEGHEVTVEYSGNGTVTIEPGVMPADIPNATKDIGIFININTVGEVEDLYITIRYSDEELEGVNEAYLRMYCYLDPGEYDPGEYDPGEYDPGEYGGWVMIKNSGVDIHSNIVWAKVSHTTIFAPMARETSKQTGSGTTATWLWYSSIVAVLAIILLIFISVIMKKKGVHWFK